MNKPVISIIVAMSENKVIGNEGTIPWHIREDLIRFREKTMGHVVIMGRKSFDWMMGYYKKSGNPLPDRTHIIVTRKSDYQTDIPNSIVCNSIEEAITEAKNLEKEEIFVSGGAQIFKQTIEIVDKLYLTIVKGQFEGDSYFPEYEEKFKKVIEKSEWKNNGKHEYQFIDLER